MTSIFSWTSVILLFYAVNELLSVEAKIYECFAFAMIFKKNTDFKNGHIIYTVSCYFIPSSPEKRAMACYKLGFEEFIIINKMFVQIFVLLNNLFNVLCWCVLCSRIYLYKLNFSKKRYWQKLIMCKMLSKKIQNFINIIIHTILTIMHTKSSSQQNICCYFIKQILTLYLAHSQWSLFSGEKLMKPVIQISCIYFMTNSIAPSID